ncbi:MAG: GNAT family N-acetyltransferase [Paludibacter sp.]|nr:GNAT family N-acetyltransferase [Paludibacter sp.]
METGKSKNSVRKAQAGDIDVIHNILDMEPFKYNDEVPYDREWIEQLVLNERCLTLVYETEGQIKGFISGEKMVSGAIMIWFCAVKREFQHRTIGIKLYYEFEKACKETGVNAILAYGYKTSADMLDRLNFYSNDTTYREFYKPLVESF